MGISLSFLNQLTPYSIILKRNKIIVHHLFTCIRCLHQPLPLLGLLEPLFVLHFSWFNSKGSFFNETVCCREGLGQNFNLLKQWMFSRTMPLGSTDPVLALSTTQFHWFKPIIFDSTLWCKVVPTIKKKES